MSLRPSEEPYTTIARLRAEVERLKSEEECPACGPAIDRAEKAESERDEALSEVERLHYKSILYEGLKHRISQLERERDEALARVAVLTLALEDALSDIHYHQGCDPRCEERLHVLASPLTKASVLLNKLQRAESVVEAAQDAAGRSFALVDGDSNQKKMNHEFVMSLVKLRDALSAWEEGKARWTV